MRARLRTGAEPELGPGPESGQRRGSGPGLEQGSRLEPGPGPGLGPRMELGPETGPWVGGSSGGSERREAARQRRCSGPDEVNDMRSCRAAGAAALHDDGAGVGLEQGPGLGLGPGAGLGSGLGSGTGPGAGAGPGRGGEEDEVRVSPGGGGARRQETQRRVVSEQAKGRKRRGEMEEEGGEWQTCAVGECRVGVGRVVAGTRVIQLAEVVAGRRRTRKKQNIGDSSGPVSQIRNRMLQAGVCETSSVVCLFRDKSENHVTQVGGMTFCVSVCRGGSSVGAASGLSGETEERTWVIKRCVEKAMEVAESRRGYVYGAAWDEGNMIQAMARLKNPTIAWRYGDG